MDQKKGIQRQSLQFPERLFSAGLSGEIVEWDLRTLKPKVNCELLNSFDLIYNLILFN